MSNDLVRFNRPVVSQLEEEYLLAALRSEHLAGDGAFTKRCHAWAKQYLGVRQALLTHSCTAALELACLLADLKPGDEVILPSYTFSSTANAVVLRGAVPVFVDVREDTINLDEKKIEAAITARTRAILVVHYAGVACEMDAILKLARDKNLLVIEDAAQGIDATYKGRRLGTFGDAAGFSFHHTKNLVSGEGGLFVTSREDWADRAEIVREKGTNRSLFHRGQVDKYTWVDIGSSYLPSELNAAVLLAQFERMGEIQKFRREVWSKYHLGLADLERVGRLRRPVVPSECEHNAHMYYVLTKSLDERARLIQHLRAGGVEAVYHYIPLHSAPAGRKFGRTSGELRVTDDVADRLLRLPLHWQFGQTDRVLSLVHDFYR